MARRSLQLAWLAACALLLGAVAEGCADDDAPPPTCSELRAAWQARADQLSTLCGVDDDCVVIGHPGSCNCTPQRGSTSGCGLGVRRGGEVDARLLELEETMNRRCQGLESGGICDCAAMTGRCLLARCRAEFVGQCFGDAGP